jgi:hypothetical protein
MPIAVPLPIAKGGTGQAATGNNAFSAGVDAVAESENSISIGTQTTVSTNSLRSLAFGYGCGAYHNDSYALGKWVKLYRQNTMELGYWTSPSSIIGGRAGAIRVDNTGLVSFTTINQEAPLVDGGEFPGGEASGELPRNAMAFRTFQGRLFIDTNIEGVDPPTGTIKTREINATYRGQCSLNSPTSINFTGTGYGVLTGNATFDQNVAYGTSGSGFIITNTSGENRIFNVTAQVEIEKTTSGTLDYGLKIAKNNALIDETEVQENSSLNNPAYLTTTWMVGLNDQESVALAIASVSGTGPATVNRARLTMFAV